MIEIIEHVIQAIPMLSEMAETKSQISLTEFCDIHLIDSFAKKKKPEKQDACMNLDSISPQPSRHEQQTTESNTKHSSKKSGSQTFAGSMVYMM